MAVWTVLSTKGKCLCPKGPEFSRHTPLSEVRFGSTAAIKGNAQHVRFTLATGLKTGSSRMTEMGQNRTCPVHA
jgi:hypothetical protein